MRIRAEDRTLGASQSFSVKARKWERILEQREIRRACQRRMTTFSCCCVVLLLFVIGTEGSRNLGARRNEAAFMESVRTGPCRWAIFEGVEIPRGGHFG